MLTLHWVDGWSEEDQEQTGSSRFLKKLTDVRHILSVATRLTGWCAENYGPGVIVCLDEAGCRVGPMVKVEDLAAELLAAVA